MRPRGHKPGHYGEDLRGLKVKHADAVKETGAHGYGKLAHIWRPAGWYVWVQFTRGGRIVWQAVSQLRFVRERDALLACRALVAAGLDSAKRMKSAGGEIVLQIAFEALQW